MSRLTKSQTIGRKAITALTTASLVFGGVTVTHTVVTPVAVAQTSAPAPKAYSPANAIEQAEYQEAGLLYSYNQQYGWGWCADVSSYTPGPQDGAKWEVQKLDYYTRYLPQNVNNPQTFYFNSGNQFDADVRLAIMSLTKRMVEAFHAGDYNTAEQVNMALRVFTGHTVNSTTRAAWSILNGGKDNWNSRNTFNSPSHTNFMKWTGFKLVTNGNYPLLERLDGVEIPYANQFTSSSYVTILVPPNFKLNNAGRFDTYPQRLIVIDQPGLPIDKPKDPEKPSETPTPTPEQPKPSDTPKPTPTNPQTTESTVVIGGQETVHVLKYVFSYVITQRFNFSQYINYVYNRQDVKIVEGSSNIRIEYDANGNMIIVPIKSGPVVIEIKGSDGIIRRYELVVSVGGNTGGGTVVVNPNPVYVDITNNTYYITNITNITNVNVVSGSQYIIDARIVDGQVVVTPKPGQQGQTYIIITDSRGVQYKYYINVNYQVSVQEYTNTIYQGGSTSITINNGYTWSIESGSEYIDVTKGNGGIVIRPKDGANGQAVIVIKDQYGNIVYRYIINVRYQSNQYSSTVTIDNTQSFTFDYRNFVKYEITKGSNLIDVRIVNGQMIVTPKPGSQGQAVIVVTDKYGNTTTITINILDSTPAVPDTQVIERTISADRTISFSYNTSYNVKVVEGGNIANVDIKNGRITVTPKDFQADGRVVIEVTDSNGNVIYRYIVNITPVQLSHTESNITIKDTQDISIPVAEDSTIEITEGADIISAEIINGKVVITPVEGSEGEAKVVITDAIGNTHTINITVIKDSTVVVEKPFREYNSEVFVGADINLNYTSSLIAEFVEGEDLVDVINMDNGRIELKAAEPGKVVIEIRDDEGHVWARYNITIKELPTPELNHTESHITIKNTQTASLPKGAGDTVEITEGSDLVDVVDENGAWVIKPKDGVTEGEAVVVITDANGNTHTVYVTIVPDENAGEQPAPTIIKITREINDTTVVNFSHVDGWNYKITKGSEFGSFKIVNGQLVVTPNKGANGTLVIEATDGNGNVVAEYTLIITPTQDGNTPQVGGEVINITTINQVTIVKESNYTFEIESGSNLFIYEQLSNGNWVIKPLPGAEGTAVVVVKDASGKIVYRYTINITNASTTNVREVTITNGQSVNITYTYDLKVVSGGHLVDIVKENGQWVVKPKDGVSGRVVIEETTSTGHVVNRWIINVNTTGSVTQIREVRQTITNEQSIRVTADKSHTIEIISGSHIAELTGGNGTWILNPRNGDVSGEVVVVERDKDGNIITRYIITVTDPSGSTGGTQIVTREIIIKDGQQATITKPADGHTIVVVSEDAGNIGELIKNPDGSYTIKPIPGTPGGTIILEERDKDGKVVSRIEVIVQPQSKVDEQGTGSGSIVIVDGKETPVIDSKIEIIEKKDGKDTQVVIPGTGGSTIVITGPDGKVVDGFEVIEDGKDTKVIVPDGTKPGEYTVVITDKDGNKTYITIVVKGDGSGIIDEQGIGGGAGDTINNFISSGESMSSNKDKQNSGSAERCFRDPASNPLVWLLPVGLLLGIGGPILSSMLGQAGSAFGQFGHESGKTIRDEFGNRVGVRDTRPKWMRDISAQLGGLNRNLSRIHPQGGQLVGVAGAVAGVALIASLFAISCSEEGWDGFSSKLQDGTTPDA